MAMLDRYDISNLPAPMSRGEKLLYKIAVGETDLSDVPGYLSRYEELLKYLIENGGIIGGDFEYVLYTINQSLYTLYTTAEKPVKSAILKGNTLVNLVANPTHTFTQTSTINETWKEVNKYFTVGLQVGKTYIALWDMTWTNSEYTPTPAAFCFRNKDNEGIGRYSQLPSGKYYCKVTIDRSVSTPTMFRFHTSLSTAIENTLTVSNFIVLEYQEGMENWDIPYFTGMQSVKMPVLTTTDKSPTIIPFDVLENAEFKNVGGFTSIPLPYELVDVKCIIKIREDYPHNIKFQIGDIEFTDTGDTLIKGKEYVKYISAMNDIRIYNWADIINGNGKEPFLNALKDGSISITLLKDGCKLYPYYGNDIKTNILTVNEDVELGGVGKVQDELNCLTGEVIIRTGIYTYKGEIEPYFNQSIGGYVAYVMANANVTLSTGIISDKFINRSFTNNDTGVYGNNNGAFYFFDKLVTSAQEFKEKYIGTNFRFELKEESIKTVDLTTVDQDNKPTQLGTFENITHVSLESAGLIPEVEMEVATRISKELASASPLMDDISTKQEQLNTTVDEQSNNVDATMIATTEIFEETL